MYLQLSPLVLHREQIFSYASLVQQTFRFRQASQLGISVIGMRQKWTHTNGRSFLDLYFRPMFVRVSMLALEDCAFAVAQLVCRA